MMPVIAVRLPEKDKETGKRLYKGDFDEDGRPLCACGKAMEYVLTGPEEGHLFRCPAYGCEAEDKDGVAGRCDGQCYVKPEGRLLWIVGLLPRGSEEWKAEYKKRTVIECFFSSDKHSCLLNQHRYLNMFQMSLHVLLFMLSYLATALAHLQADDYAHMRHMRIKLPKARGERRRRRLPSPACRDPDCACCDQWREAA